MIDRAWLVLRALALVLVLQAVGGALFCRVFRGASQRVAEAVRGTTWRVSVMALAAVVVQALFEPVHLAGEVSGLADRSLLRVFIGSSVAQALVVRIAGVACGTYALRPGAALPALAVAAAVLLTSASFPVTGHTVVAAHHAWVQALLLVHVAVVTFWFGALWPLRQVLALEAPANAARTIAAFSAVAVRLVPWLGIAGALLAALLLPDAAALARPWGLLLLGKVLLFTGLMALAAVNRLRLTPALARADGQAAAQLSRTITLEYLLISLTLTVTAVMTGSFSPAGE
jgi:putative copper resistance protein D